MRCVHLDFHTSDEIEGIGKDFDKEEFKAALKVAGVDSITLFAKCHHGNFYYPSSKFRTHPHLAKPLLDLQVEACREIGVSAKIYLSAGYDEYLAATHPEWLFVPYNGQPQNLLEPVFHPLCFHSPYLDVLVEQTIEATRRYMPDGLFLDIVYERPCCCSYCRRSMKEKGLDPENYAHVMTHAEQVFRAWTARVTAAAKSVKPDVMMFYNAGDFPIGRQDRMACCHQLEAESLPTGGWGYDHFPMSMAHIRRQGKNCIGMTGKFHLSWGEFGGFKYKDALLYEGAQCLAFDASLSVGDQLHPTGRVDRYTYENIGNAMGYLAAREHWRGGDYRAEMAVLSNLHTLPAVLQRRSGEILGRTGACRMLFEGKYFFDLIGYEEIDNRYRFILLADERIELNEREYVALKGYVDKGGKILACGKAPLYEGKVAFDLGAEWMGEDTYKPSYLRADYKLAAADGMALVVYEPFYQIRLTGEKLGDQIHPYFQRGGTHFCSHNNTPCNYDDVVPAITRGKDGIYVAAEILADYAKCGSLVAKQIMLPLFDLLLEGNKTVVSTNLPSSGKIALYEKEGSYVLHMLYANTVKRGSGVEVIEDIVTLSDISCTLRLPRKVTKAILHPEERQIPLRQNTDGTVTMTLDKLYCSAIVELQ